MLTLDAETLRTPLPPDPGSGYRVDSTLLYVLMSELQRSPPSARRIHAIESYLPFADPTQVLTVPGPVFSALCVQLYDAWGPQRFCRTLIDGWVEQWTPVSTLFATARDASQVARRLHSLERLFARTCVSEISVVGDNCVSVRRVLLQDIALTASHSIAYWSYLLSAFKAAGCENIRLDTSDRCAINGENLNPEALNALSSEQCMRISWDGRKRKPATFMPRLRVPSHAKLVSDVLVLLETSLAEGNRIGLPEAASAVCQSTRTLQRRLREANVSLSQMRLALQLYKTTCLLAESRTDLTQVASIAGFTDASHLIHRFQQATSMTPREFQRRLIQ